MNPLGAAPPPFPTRQPLPQNPFNQADDAPSHDAYQFCLANEADAQDEKHLVYARLLGYLMRENAAVDSRVVLAHEIFRCKGDNASMDALAQFYIDHLIRLCKSFSIFSAAFL